eukprot:TRINITY_DN5289_c0_g1_i2.p1 TRINITY_DN5289_c0_g1~~TRINITY_DN5289_c0_g1_i2.p1  ORF type:complete len:186 (-),score=33.17 TRINITY_DN5289_c0_g1_i2:24-581(-)
MKKEKMKRIMPVLRMKRERKKVKKVTRGLLMMKKILDLLRKKARRADSEEDADSDDSEDSDAGHDRTAIHEGDDNIRALLSQFNHDQQNRYEYYRRAAFQRTNIKKVMQTVANSAVSQTMSIVMGGITKVFVGELIETARTVMDEWKENGPIKPRHLREAYRRMRSVGLVPYAPHRGRRALRHYR